jgi:hypothetical protein
MFKSLAGLAGFTQKSTTERSMRILQRKEIVPKVFIAETIENSLD